MQTAIRVEVYFNLHRKVWSIRDKKTRRVIQHAERVWLTDCKFKVSAAGRARVLRERRKNVHAFVEGYLFEVPADTPSHSVYNNFELVSDRVSYNPYKTDSFCYAPGGTIDTNRPIKYARMVMLDTKLGVWIKL